MTSTVEGLNKPDKKKKPTPYGEMGYAVESGRLEGDGKSREPARSNESN